LTRTATASVSRGRRSLDRLIIILICGLETIYNLQKFNLAHGSICSCHRKKHFEMLKKIE
jgi:hypothetical protein